MDGPDYEALFTKMQSLHGGNAEDVKIIVRYLRFYRDQGGFETYAAHYLPMLPPDVAAEFTKAKTLPATKIEVKEEPKKEETKHVKHEEKPVTKSTIGEITVKPEPKKKHSPK